MGSAEIISLSEVRASRQWALLREQLHARFDHWLDELQEQLPAPHQPGTSPRRSPPSEPRWCPAPRGQILWGLLLQVLPREFVWVLCVYEPFFVQTENGLNKCPP